MADPVKTLRSLEVLNNDYAVFERDQVLTEAQLNSVAAYFDDQERLTRIHLLGVGIVAGLRVAIVANKVRVGKGVGLTTDGDLLALSHDTLFDGYKAYDESAPVYDPFYDSSDPSKMLKVFELIREGESDPLKSALSTIPGGLSNYVVVLYMECFEQDHDLCDVADCDNRGIVSKHSQRVLLIARADIGALKSALSPLLPLSQMALDLPVAKGVRPKLGVGIDTVSKFTTLMREAANATHVELRAILPTLATIVPAFLGQTFGGNPIATWVKRLDDHAAAFASKSTAIQYYYAFLCDLVEAWNDLRDALLDDDSVLCPSLMAFPKHLLLGDLNSPLSSRTGLYPSPLSSDSRRARSLASDLALRLQTLILAANFDLPPVVVTNIVNVPGDVAGTVESRKVLGSLRVTPSRSSVHPLHERAIPVYYAHDPAHPVLSMWNLHLDRRKGRERNFGYRWAEYAGKAAPDFFAAPIARCDFFRIEGHLGQHINDVTYTLGELLRTHNLAIQVRSILLHNDRKRIVRRPPRYTDLHRLHYILRKDLQSELSYSRAYNSSFYERISKVVDAGPGTVADTQRKKIEKAIDQANPKLGTARYSAYRKAMEGDGVSWVTDYQSVVEGASTVKKTFGERVRTDYISPFDSVIATNHAIWVQWIDQILDKKDERADDKLLMANMFREHPGIEHGGGVHRGGTFVLVYDDLGNVVADFTLPYAVVETGENEADEPELTVPPHRLPELLDIGYELIEPLDIRFVKEFTDFERHLRPQWEKEIDIQRNYEVFFKETLGTLGDVLNKYSGARTTYDPGNFATGDAYLDALVNEARTQTELIDKLRGELANPALSREAERNILVLVESKEAALAKTVQDTTRYLVESKTNVGAGQPAAGTVEVLGAALAVVKNDATRKGVQVEFQAMTELGLDMAQINLINGIANVGGIGFRK
jgi:hypothetical protein